MKSKLLISGLLFVFAVYSLVDILLDISSSIGVTLLY